MFSQLTSQLVEWSLISALQLCGVGTGFCSLASTSTSTATADLDPDQFKDSKNSGEYDE
jgi:hypothetical protein